VTVSSAEWSEIIERAQAEEKEGDSRAGSRRENEVDMCSTTEVTAKRR
jgi:hypothetical protein